MNVTDRVYQHTLERVVDGLAHRYADTFDRAEVASVVARGRAVLERTGHHPEFIPALVEHWAKDELVELARRRGQEARPVPAILFVCEHNEGRSQIAAALAEHLAGEHVHVRSAGVHPTSRCSPQAVEALAERGISLRTPYQRGEHEDALDAADVVVLMGVTDCEEAGRRTVRWDVADPHDQPLEVVRGIRDEVEALVRALLAELEVPVEGLTHEPGAAAPADTAAESGFVRRQPDRSRSPRTNPLPAS